MKKRTLKAKVAALEQRMAQAVTAENRGRHNRKELMDRLAAAGLILVDGARTHEDRLRAARAGVLVLDDVAVLADSQYTIEQDEVPSFSAYGFSDNTPGPIRATMRLDFTGDPEILELLAAQARQPR